jgi:hypothetical protein
MRSSLSTLSLVLASSLALLACGGGAAPAAAPAGATSSAPTAAAGASDLKKPGEAKVGDKSTCLVSGEEFVVAADSPSAEYEGKTYYFCCPPCVGKFKADPKKYVH